MNKHLKLLGHRVRDVMTGFEGTVTAISFDVSGCIQAIVVPPRDSKAEKIPEAMWFDTKRLEQLSKMPLMEQPTFEHIPGGQNLPALPAHRSA